MRDILQEKKRYFKFILIFLSAIILLIPNPIGISSGETTITTATDIIHPLIVSTRDQFDNMTGELLSEHNKTNYTASDIPSFKVEHFIMKLQLLFTDGVLMKLRLTKYLLEQICH